MAIYKGFSSIAGNSKFRLTDFELVKQDLRNYLNTRRGERLMNPEFGCIIWELLFEPLTPSIKNTIVDNLTKIVRSDPRVSAESINVIEFEQGIRVELEIRFLQTNEVSKMYANFSKT